jgi:hypothetical protein
MAAPFTCPQGHQWSSPDDKLSVTGVAIACPVCGAAPTLDGLGAPPAVAAAVQRLRDDLARAAGKNLAGLVLYGGLARGRYRPGQSDINVVVLLHDASAGALAAITPALRAAWRAARVEPLLLTPAEVPASAAAFPTKFVDIAAHHIVLAGEDAFAGLEVPRDRLRLRIEQALRNLVLRLRRRYVAVGDDPAAQAAALADVARPLALELGALLRLAGKEVPAEDRTAAVYEAAARAFELDRESLARLAELRSGAKAAEDMSALYQHVLGAIARAADLAAHLKEPSS